jgi:hypothetical protein
LESFRAKIAKKRREQSGKTIHYSNRGALLAGSRISKFGSNVLNLRRP